MGSGLVVLDNVSVGQREVDPAAPVDIASKYLREQADLSAVERFSQLHDDASQPLQEQYYRELIPLSRPGPGEQYAFEVDLDLCTGCKGCVTACKSLNGLSADESWRDVGLVHGRGKEGSVQHVTTACHHCLEPACALGCPVDAYEKQPDTGIVKHLDDQCIGCQYCTLTCPYDVPKFSKSLGIVRKCDMCVDRLNEGEAPACVQSCPNEAIKIGLVGTDEVLNQAEVGMGLSGAPPSHITFPTTRFKTKRASVRELLPADYDQPTKQHGHSPLIVMLVLTQVAVGVFLADWTIRLWLPAEQTLGIWGHGVGLGVCLLALAASVLHLGRPQYAFRAVVGLRHSWLSREILAFGLFVKAAALATAMQWVTGEDKRLDALSPTLEEWVVAGTDFVEWTTLFLGLSGVYASVMVYHVTRRIFWNAIRTLPRFFLTVWVGGASCLMFVGLLRSSDPSGFLVTSNWVAHLSLFCGLGMVAKLLIECSVFWSLRDKTNSSLKRTARLHIEHMKGVCLVRLAGGLFGGVVVPVAVLHAMERGVMSHGSLAFLAGLGFLALLVGELAERYLFFTAVVALKMPGRVPG